MFASLLLSIYNAEVSEPCCALSLQEKHCQSHSEKETDAGGQKQLGELLGAQLLQIFLVLSGHVALFLQIVILLLLEPGFFLCNAVFSLLQLDVLSLGLLLQGL